MLLHGQQVTFLEAGADSGGARSPCCCTAWPAAHWSGQRLEGTERLYLLAEVPVLLVGGCRDSVIPIEHTVAAHTLLPSSGLQIFEGAGHFPHAEQPARFAELLTHFLTDTRAARSDLQSLRRRLQSSAALHSPTDVPVA
jgi:pimeloyl-ACP methyl ester carboxylesterase